MFASGKGLKSITLATLLTVLAAAVFANETRSVAEFSLDGVDLNTSEIMVSKRLGKPDEEIRNANGLGYRLKVLNGSDLLIYGDTLVSIRNSRVVGIHGHKLNFNGQEIASKGKDLRSTLESISQKFGSPTEIEETSSFDPDEKSISWERDGVFLGVIFIKDLADEIQLYTR